MALIIESDFNYIATFSTVPVYLSWLKYISRFYYGLEALSIFHWTGVKDIRKRLFYFLNIIHFFH